MSEEPGAAPLPETTPEAPPEAAPDAPAAAEVAPEAAPAPDAPAEAAATDPTTAIPTPTEPVGAAGTPPPTVPVEGSTGGTGGGRNALIIGAVIVAAAIVVGALVIGQNLGSSSSSPSAAPSVAPTATAAPSATPEPTPTPAPTPTPNACAPGNLATLAAGTLTIGTDNPAYPPYFAIREGGNTPPWEDLGFTGDPTTGEGFESAVAYAVAKQLGFADTQVSWVVVPFANAIAPGPKQYDFVINQVSFSTERAAAVDLTDGYYDLNQAVVALKDNPAAGAKSIADLKPYRFGAQTGTTSYTAIETVINPDPEIQVFNDNASAVQALQSKLIDVLVVDLPTADFVTRVQVVDADFNPLATIVGQLAPAGGVQEYFSLALNKDSALTACLNEALAALREDGTLDKLASTWLPFQEDVPVLP